LAIALMSDNPSIVSHQSTVATWTPLTLVVAVSLTPVLGLFTTHRIFFVRDLSFFFWSRHLWLRHTIYAGQAPWWDPYVANGQSAIADALNQLLMPLTLAIRLLPSDVVSFNLWVALPLPVAAWGTFRFLRRQCSDVAAALGACVFVLCGPVVSMLNAPNLSWSVALLPWVLWATQRERHSSIAVAIAFALQGLCGEPVTGASTAVVAIGSVAAAQGWRAALRCVAGLAAGAGLAAVQLLPTSTAGMAAHRGMLATPDFWSLHPLALWETIAPHLFGDYYTAFLADLPWMGALNFGRDPFFYSLYIGPIVLLIAAFAVVRRERVTAFWTLAALAFVVAALGGYTPIYPLVRNAIPGLMFFRFPVKYFVVAAFAIAVLAARGWDALVGLPPEGGSHNRMRVWLLASAGSLAVAGLCAATAAMLRPVMTTSAAYWLAVDTHLKSPAAGAEFLARTAPPLLARASALLLAGCILVRLAGSLRYRRIASVALFTAVCLDLVVTNGTLNPTADAAAFAPPWWYTSLGASPARLYIGGRVRGFMNTWDPDASSTWRVPAESTAVLGRMELNAQLPMAPSGWGVRETLSYDLPLLWPAEYEHLVRRFEHANARERDAFLQRTGITACVLPATQQRPWRIVADVPDWSMRVYECYPRASRVFVVAGETFAANADEAWQREALFDIAAPSDVVRLASVPRGSARAGPPRPASARITRDTPNDVIVDAALPTAGVLVLRDSYDPSWHASVDGADAEVVRANGIFRAVALPAGRHEVRFTYRPEALRNGLIVSGLTVVLIGFTGFKRFKGFKGSQRFAGFTLIELMVVAAILSILLALAFAEYRNLRAKGNESSAESSLRAIATAQWEYAHTCGNQKYVTKLPDLAQPAPATGHGFLSPDLTSGETIEKSGYTIHLTAKPRDDAALGCNGAALADSYAATADPLKPGTSGAFYYGINADRVLYEDDRQTFAGNMPETGAPSHGTEVK
jgi:prepilin-type N-terminal cleavage/methylation domain-containing protein